VMVPAAGLQIALVCGEPQIIFFSNGCVPVRRS
jgi:hypothetical protein